jgi:hypothetical protein
VQRLYSVPGTGALPVSGTLTPTDGGTLPADFLLTVECPDGFRMLTEPAIVYTDSGIAFSFWVGAAKDGADNGTLTVSSNYPATSWTPDSTTLKKIVAAPLPEGSPRIFFAWEDEYYTVVPKGDGFSGIHTVTGQVRVPEGTTLPANLKLLVQALTSAWGIFGVPGNEVADWTQPRPDNWNDIKPAGWDDLWG